MAKNLRAHATIVLDNLELEGLSPAESDVFVREFQTTILRLFAPFAAKHHFIIVSSSFPLSAAKGLREFVVPALSEVHAKNFALELLPADPISLMTGCRRLAGEMSRISRQCSLTTIRKLAAIFTVDESAISAGRKCMMEGIEADMNEDHLLAAACMLTGLPYFNEGHAWALCQDAFQNDLLRWRVAWQGLVDKGWVEYSQTLGYRMNSLSVVSREVVSSVPITLETQTRALLLYWAKELVRVNCFSFESSCSMLLFDQYHRYFRTVLSYYLPKTSALSRFSFRSKPKEDIGLFEPTLLDVSMKEVIAGILAGGLERVLNSRFTQQVGLAVSNNIMETLRSAAAARPDTSTSAYLLACRDNRAQILRSHNASTAEKVVKQLTDRVQTNLEAVSLAQQSLFSIVLANAYLAKHQLKDAKVALWEARRRLALEAMEEVPWEFTQGTLTFVGRILTKMEKDSQEWSRKTKTKREHHQSGQPKRCSIM